MFLYIKDIFLIDGCLFFIVLSTVMHYKIRKEE